MRSRREGTDTPRSVVKVHWIETGTKAACGQTVTTKSTNRLDLVTCGRCLAVAKRRREKHPKI